MSEVMTHDYFETLRLMPKKNKLSETDLGDLWAWFYNENEIVVNALKLAQKVTGQVTPEMVEHGVFAGSDTSPQYWEVLPEKFKAMITQACKEIE